MKVGQQIQVRMDQLGVSVPELAKRAGVSAQAVRHWISGRSFPGKRHAPAVEQALSFRIDFTEGVSTTKGRETASTMMERQDVELMLLISKLSPRMRVALHQLVEASIAESRGPFTQRVSAKPVEEFFERRSQEGAKRSKARASS